jgi:hypothetical protein
MTETHKQGMLKIIQVSRFIGKGKERSVVALILALIDTIVADSNIVPR